MKCRLAVDPIYAYGRTAARHVRECLHNVIASELRRIQQEQRFATGLHRRTQRVDTRQQTGEVEARGAQFAGIEIVLRFFAQRSFGHQCPHVGIRRVSECLQIFDRSRANFVRVVFCPIQQPRGQLVERVDGIVQRLGEFAQIGAASVEYLQAFGYVSYAYMWALMAKASLGKEAQDDFYASKLGTARFYFARLLPRIHSLSASVKAGSESLFLLDAAQF